MTTHGFPDNFVFGAATSAYQIEGAWNVDGKGPSIWDTFSQTPGKVWNDIPGNDGSDHYHRWAEDIALMKEIGLQSYRFSLSWPRLIPQGVGQVNEKGIDFYDRLIDGLLEAGIAPNATLYHWDLPQALEDRGGWPNRDVVDWFGEYAALAFDRFGDRVPRWATINEPIALWVGYGLGVFAPGHTDPVAGKQAMHNAMLAHGRAVQEFRAAGSPGEIGIVLDIWKRHPATDSAADLAVAQRDEDDGFRFFLDELFGGGWSPRLAARMAEEGTTPLVLPGDAALAAEPIDFLGLNVYSRIIASAENQNPRWWEDTNAHPGGNYLTNGQEYYPQALSDAVQMVGDDYGVTLPIFITENGMSIPSDAVVDGQVADPERIDYVSGFLANAASAIESGADIRGYYLWSLLDNYEWSAATSQRYGIVHVDFETQERTLKDSAKWYQQVIRERQVTDTNTATS